MTECPMETTFMAGTSSQTEGKIQWLSVSLYTGLCIFVQFHSPQGSRLQVCVKINCWQEETSPSETIGPFIWGRTLIKELWGSLKLNLGKIPPQSFYLTFTWWQIQSFSRHLKKLLSQVCQVFLDPVKILHSKKKYVLCLWKAGAIPWWKMLFIPTYQALKIERNAKITHSSSSSCS